MTSWKAFYLVSFLFLMSGPATPEAMAQDTSLPAGFLGHKVIVLDPGHGGNDLGAVGPSGLAEKSVTLVLGQRIRDHLAGSYSVHLTRDGDYWVDIEERTAMANHLRADVFISLHVGGSFRHKARGMAIFCHGPGISQGQVAHQEDRVLEAEQRLHPWNRIQRRHATKSKLLANLVHGQLLAGLNPIDSGVHQASCLVLSGADMPAILVEIGYVSHPDEEQELRDPRIISAIAEAIGQGIREFFRQTSGCINGKSMINGKIATGRGAAW